MTPGARPTDYMRCSERLGGVVSLSILHKMSVRPTLPCTVGSSFCSCERKAAASASASFMESSSPFRDGGRCAVGAGSFSMAYRCANATRKKTTGSGPRSHERLNPARLQRDPCERHKKHISLPCKQLLTSPRREVQVTKSNMSLSLPKIVAFSSALGPSFPP